MKILGIETSCDETAIAIIDATETGISVLSSVVSSQVKMHAEFGGVVPILAARAHAENIGHVFDAALKEAGASMDDISLIAVTRGPGLGPALLQGLTFARTIAMKHDIPIIGVNHMDGHVHSNWLEPEPVSGDVFPALNLLVSGGHTELVLMRDHGEYERVGETLDDAVGEAFDKVARLLGLGYPGGPALSKLALNGDSGIYDLPRPLLKQDNFNFSYSGLKTAVLYLVQGLTEGSPSDSSGRYPLSEKQKADIAASFQEAAIDVLVQKTKRAAQEHDVKSILLSGGVSANALLRERMRRMADELGIAYHQSDLQWTGDNAAMIAVAGYFQHKKATDTSWESVAMDTNLRLGNT